MFDRSEDSEGEPRPFFQSQLHNSNSVSVVGASEVLPGLRKN